MKKGIRNGHLKLDSGAMDYIRFGSGRKVLVMLPGVGDGLKTVRGMALPFALLYRPLMKHFTVYVFSRRVNLPAHMTTREMADDVSQAMEKLGLSGAAVLGISQGGMIAQWLAVDHPEKVEKLVLAVTMARPNKTIRYVVRRWMRMAKKGDYKRIMLDTAKRSYSEKKALQAKILYGILGNAGKPKSFDRFLTQAESCLTHRAYKELPRIKCPTYVIGGEKDRIVTGKASRELAGKIPDCRLTMYEDLGHALYEEAPDFLRNVIDFCS